ncbi:DUF1983 domain-containing protein [Halorhodospira sp. 9622]|uniref:phage tail tip fiber protein n=1 Tax=Halorhodospira sp. 9622 TaxID=2899136 RepID=UPI001EE96B63|nr:DUF1983 domain-containing protein [Halorhodospira sp. 9622]MCG5537855.1 DUF1983 domain-containing protein [Halorhodospira sp. 9622]
MSKPTRTTQLPSVPTDASPAERQFLDAVKQVIELGEGQRGDPLDAKLTRRDLVEMGLAKLKEGLRAGVGVGGTLEPVEPPPNVTTPPRVADFQAQAAFTRVILTWGRPQYSNHSHVEIWRAQVADIGQAVMVGVQFARIHTDVVGSSWSGYYWARNVSLAGVRGPFSQSRQAETARDADYFLEQLTGEITESQLYDSLNQRIDLIDGDMDGSVNARVAHEREERIEADEALAQDITQVSASVGENQAAIEERAKVTVDGEDVNAQWTLRLQTTNDGTPVVGGIGLEADGDAVTFGLNVDRLWLGHPSVDYTQEGKVFPFVVDGGTVYLNEAVIKDASISYAQIKQAAVDQIAADSLEATEAYIGDLNVWDLGVENAIQSDNFAPGNSGFRIRRDGTAEFMNGYFRGNIHATSADIDNILTLGGNNVVITRGSNLTSRNLSTSWRELGSVNLNSEGQPARIDVMAMLFGADIPVDSSQWYVSFSQGSTSIGRVQARLLKNGSTVHSWGNVGSYVTWAHSLGYLYIFSQGLGPMSLSYLDQSPGTGTNTYTVQARYTGSNMAFENRGGTMTATGLKR